jgi:hypothetical protein
MGEEGGGGRDSVSKGGRNEVELESGRVDVVSWNEVDDDVSDVVLRNEVAEKISDVVSRVVEDGRGSEVILEVEEGGVEVGKADGVSRDVEVKKIFVVVLRVADMIKDKLEVVFSDTEDNEISELASEEVKEEISVAQDVVLFV